MNWWLELKSLRQRWYGRTIHIPYLHDISERAWLICVTNRMNVISVASRVMDAAPSGSYERGRGWRSLLICRSVFFFFFFVFFFTRWANRNRPTVWSRWRRRTWWSCRCWRPAARTPWPTRSKSSPNSCGRWCTSKRSTTVGCSTRDRSCPHTAPPLPTTFFLLFPLFSFCSSFSCVPKPNSLQSRAPRFTTIRNEKKARTRIDLRSLCPLWSRRLIHFCARSTSTIRKKTKESTWLVL